MSLEAILKNICTFLELLQKVRTSEDLGWNADTFQRAFRWAEYCERIYLQAVGKPFFRQLDLEIRKLNCLPWALGDLTIDLDLLKDSVGWLSLALIQNESPTSSIIRLKLIQEKASHNEFLKNKLREMIAIDSIVKRMLSVKQRDEERDVVPLTCDMKKLKFEASATLLADYVQKNLTFELHDATLQRMVLRNKLVQLADSECGLVIILKTYLVLFENQNKKCRRVLQYFDDFVSGLVKRSDVNFWCSLPKDIVVELCSTNEEFLKKLFQDLNSASKNFEIHYNENVIDKATGKISLFCWRFRAHKTKSPSPITSSEQLKEWIVVFLDAPDMRDNAAEIVSELARGSEINVWKTLLQELRRIDLLIDYR